MNVLARRGLPGLRGGVARGSVRFVVTDLTPKETPTLGSPTEDKRVKIDFPPFVKDLFSGTFNKSILSYAEVLNYERYFVLTEQTRQLSELLSENKEKVSAINQRGVVPEEILSKMKALDMFGLLVPNQYGGGELMQTEALRLFQELGEDLALSELFNINENMCTKAIVKYGSEEQKKKYLPEISVGELWTGFCLAEAGAGSDPNSVVCKAVKDEETYRLTGTKTWVSNAIRADLLLVFAKVQSRNYIGEKEDMLTGFLVDKSTAGIEVSSPYDLAGFNGLQVCDVKFDCEIPASSVLGSEGMGVELLQSINHENKYFMAAGIVNRLKKLLNATTKHTLTRKQYGSKLSEFELIRIQIGKCTSRIYALESMLYITAGLADVGINPDIEVESAITKQFAVETFDFVTRICLNILGAQTNLKDSVYQEYLAENQALQSWQGSSNIIKCFIAISGIIHLSNKNGEELLKCRNPGLHPIKSLKYKIGQRRHRHDFSPKTYMLEHHVHPRMQKTAPLVEWASHKLNHCTEHLLMSEGLNVQVKEANLERLSNIAMETYAMICVMARASRSYVVGHPHANHDINLSIPFIFESRSRVEQAVKEIVYFDDFQGQRDLYYEESGVYVIEQGGYCATHPLIKATV